MNIIYGNLIDLFENNEIEVLIHGCNCFHTMGAGIAKTIKENYPKAYVADKKTPYGSKEKLGTYSVAELIINNNKQYIVNAYTQFNYGRNKDNFSYETFPALLQKINKDFSGKKIGLPLIGCGLAGGNETKILQMIKDHLTEVEYSIVEIDKNKKIKLNVVNEEYCYFVGAKNEYSNFYPAIINYKDFTFISNEQFFIYSKARQFNDKTIADKILQINNEELANSFINGRLSAEDIANNPTFTKEWQGLMVKIKKLGRKIENFQEDIWNDKKIKIMLFGLQMKFEQNENLLDKILKEHRKFAEANKYDKLWGIGLEEYEAKKVDPSTWPGQNLLGNLLNETRDRIQNKYKNKVLNYYKIGKVIDQNSVYIGRANIKKGLIGSKLANPFPINDDNDRNSVIKKYRDYFFSEISEGRITKPELIELKGKNLVCFCNPLPCHGDIIKEAVELLVRDEKEFDKLVETEIQRKSTKVKP